MKTTPASKAQPQASSAWEAPRLHRVGRLSDVMRGGGQTGAGDGGAMMKMA